jgi:hypothetical protein
MSWEDVVSEGNHHTTLTERTETNSTALLALQTPKSTTFLHNFELTCTSFFFRNEDKHAINDEVSITPIRHTAIECRRNKPPWSSMV